MKEIEPRFIQFRSPGSFYNNILLPREPINGVVLICDFISYFNQPAHPQIWWVPPKWKQVGWKRVMNDSPRSCSNIKLQAGERHRQLPGLSPESQVGLLAEQRGAWQSWGSFSIPSSTLAWSPCSLTSVSLQFGLWLELCELLKEALATSLFKQTMVAVTKRKIRCRWKFIFNISKAKWGFNMKIRALTSASSLPKWLGCFWLAGTLTCLDIFQASAPLMR